MKLRVIDIKDIPKERRYSFNDGYENIPCLFEVEENKIVTGSYFKKNDKFYHVIGKNIKSFLVEEFNFIDVNFENTYEIVCPYCGNSDGNSMFDEGIVNCDFCGSKYEFERIIDISYTSKKIKRNSVKELKL